MKQPFISMEHLMFLLFNVHKLGEILDQPDFDHIDEEQTRMMLQAAFDLAEAELYPYFQEMDHLEPIYDPENGNIKTHPQLKKIISSIAEQGWIGAGDTFEHGGLQLPQTIFNAAQTIFQAANNGVQGYVGLSSGAARLITTFGTEDQIRTFVTPIYEGKWQGTMALTEPQAGSSLSDIATSASVTDEGYYAIKGQKIFISAGQHEACENFVHLTLAKIEGSPPGVKGISLFIIPKYRPDKNGNLVYNDVHCAGEFRKLGQRCYTTTHLAFGENNDCRGWLVGKPHEGLKYMFLMMNEARIGVGQTAAAVAHAAYLHALSYANERTQGRSPENKDPLTAPIPIYRHADVQRMLLTQKSIAEGALSLCTECNILFDRSLHGQESLRKENHLLLELLTPIAKTYSSEEGSRATALAIQTLGGYGYTMDFKLQQYYRDIRIMSIYEGTTGIQSLDLLGRKVLLENGKAVAILFKRMEETLSKADNIDELKDPGAALRQGMITTEKVLTYLSKYMNSNQIERYLADATVFMEMAGILVIGWQWVKMATEAHTCLEEKNTAFTKAFFKGKIHTSKFFFRYEMPKVEALSKVLMEDQWLTNLENTDTL